MNSKMTPAARVITLISSIVMILVLFLPIWRIELSAPQYPEGLALKIYAGAIGGDVDVVNGLNHYIGMRTLHTRDFVEFLVLPYIIGGFLVAGLLVALINRRGLFYGWALLFLLIAFTSMIDFYRWEYNYGHNLDENAPIKVPGMAYQPPLIGYKQLLNFSAYSIPDSGGWIFAAVGLLIVITAFFEWRRQKAKRKQTLPSTLAPLILFLAVLLPGCSSGPEPVRYGQDICDFCKMTIVDKRFGGEVITKKGKIYKFDDLHCLLNALQSGYPAKNEVAAIYHVDFSVPGEWVNANESLLIGSEALHSPMNGNIAAFAKTDSLLKYKQEFNAQPLVWKELYK